MMNRLTCLAAVAFTLSLISPAHALTDDIATVGLWHAESVYYDSSDLPWTADDDSQNSGRNHDMILWRSGTNETPPDVVPGYIGNALQFTGAQWMNCTNAWSSSYTEFKVDYMIYITAVPTDTGGATIYLFDVQSKSSANDSFQSGLWPGAGGASTDYMRFTAYMTSGQLNSDIVVGNLKNRWLHVVASYDSSRNFIFSVTDTTTGLTTTVTRTGTAALRAGSSAISFGSTSAYTGTKLPNRNFWGMIDELKISNKVSPAHYAYSPAPGSSATITAVPSLLTWSAGLVAQGSDVFFGTSSAAVAAASKPAFDIDGSTFVDFRDYAFLAGQWQQAPVYPSADINKNGIVNYVDLYQFAAKWLTSTATAYPLYLGGTTGNSMTCPALVPSKTYYWRVDSVSTSENTAGNIWSFTTGSAVATSPTPSSAEPAATADGNSVALRWVSGFGATSHNVYFGTAANPPFLASATGTSLASPPVAPNTKYYWRVDSVGPFGTTGTVWNFTTGSIAAISPSPVNGATFTVFPLTYVPLSWTSTFLAGSYNVYFGTASNPPFYASTTSRTIHCPPVIQNTTYYWRVDCVSVFGTVTGPVWHFTTATPAFPQAEGFGRFAKGGRGGVIYHVTSLADTNTPGTLRYGVQTQTGPRTIVFDVGGYIMQSSRLSLARNNLTIAGQTAPGQGISLAGYGLSIGADDIIVRYIRVRYTDVSTQTDGVTVDQTCQNVILDHVSASWATDEVLSVGTSGAANITVQWSMVTEGCKASYNHSKGSLLEMPILSWHHNIYAHNDDRNPKNKGTFDYRNNVVYNWGMAPYIAGGNTSAQCYANCVGNYYIAGPNSVNPQYMVIGGNNNYHMYFSDNRLDSNRNGVLDGVDLGTAMMDPSAMPVVMPTPYEFPPVTTTSPEVAYTQVLANAGCSLSRDSIDTRVINDIINQTGWIITWYTDRGGLGTITGGTAPLDTDQDGMPDVWEDAHGLNKNSSTDANIAGADGYTNLENYLNSLAVYPAP